MACKEVRKKFQKIKRLRISNHVCDMAVHVRSVHHLMHMWKLLINQILQKYGFVKDISLTEEFKHFNV